MDAKSVPVNVDCPIPLTVWKDAFTPKEIDRIIASGDRLEPMKAVLAGCSGNTDHLRFTRVAWIQKEPEIHWLHARLEEMVLQINDRFNRYDLFDLNEAFQ